MDFIKQRPWIVPLAAMLIGFLPILSSFFRQQLNQPEYQAFPVMLVAAGVFLHLRMSQGQAVDRSNLWLQMAGWVLTLTAWGILLASFIVYSPWLAMVAFVTYCLAISTVLWQYWRFDGVLRIWLLLALLVPPPLDRDKMLIERLQLFSSKVTSLMLDSIGVLHVSQGNTITLSDRELFVDEACSGIVSLISIVYWVAIYSLWQYRSLVHFGLLAAVGVAWTVLMNSLRLIVIALAWSWYEVDLIKGWPHTVLGLIMFAISVGVIYAVDRFLLALLAPINVPTESSSKRRWSVGRALVAGWNTLVAYGQASQGSDAVPSQEPRTETIAPAGWKPEHSIRGMLAPRSVFGYPATGAFAALGLAYLAFFLPAEVSQDANIRRALRQALDMNAETPIVPDSGWKLVRFSSDRREELFRWDNWGQYSRTYELQDADGFTYLLSCDFMFGPHWHDLRVCYRGTGWTINDEKVLDFEKMQAGPQEPVIVESSLSSPPVVEQFTIKRVPDIKDGLITYGAFRANGRWFNRPRGRGLWQDFIAHIVQGRDRAEQADYFQVQVTVFYEGEIDPRQKRNAEWLLHHGATWLRNHLAQDPATQAPTTTPVSR